MPKYIFPIHREVSKLDLIKIYGTDYDPASDNVRVSVLLSSEDPSSQSGGAVDTSGMSDKKTKEVVSFVGRSSDETSSFIDIATDKMLEHGHVDYLIFGEKAAEKDLMAMMDTYARDNVLRCTMKVYITKDCTANAVINDSLASDFFLSNKLDAIGKESVYGGVSSDIMLLDIMKAGVARNSSYLVPALNLTPGNEPMKIDVAGYGVFRDNKLIGYIDRNVSKFATVLAGKATKFLLYGDDDEGNPITLDVSYIKRDFQVDYDKEANEIKGITLRVRFRSNIIEIRSGNTISTKEKIDAFKQIQTDKLRSFLEYTMSSAQDWGADYTGLGRYIAVKYPKYWDAHKDDWPEIFRNLPVTYDVKSIIERSFEISDPIGPDAVESVRERSSGGKKHD